MRITAVDIDDEASALAQKLGATAVINSKRQNVSEIVHSEEKCRGADLVFEAAGIPPTFQTAMDCVRIGGRIVMVGNLASKVELPLQRCVTQQINLQGVCASSGEYDICLDLIGHGLVDIDSIISKVVPLEEGPVWFDRLHAGEQGLIKVV